MPRSADWGDDGEATFDSAGLRHSACLPSAEPNPSASLLNRVLFLRQVSIGNNIHLRTGGVKLGG